MMEAITYLYLARTSSQSLLEANEAPKSEKSISSSETHVQKIQFSEHFNLEKQLETELKKHRPIEITKGDWCKLLCSYRSAKFGKLFSRGARKVEKELDVLRMAKKLRHLEVIVDNSLLKDENRRMLVEHTPSSVIDMDDTQTRAEPMEEGVAEPELPKEEKLAESGIGNR